MNRSPIVGIFVVGFFFFSNAIASAIDIPKWWIGPKDEYEQLVQAAKKEGKLVWWSHPDPECNRLVTGPFEKEYGIQVEHTEYTSSQIVQRVILEGASKVYTVDVANLSVHHVPRLEKSGLIKKLPYRERVSTYHDIPSLVSPHSTAVVGWTAPRSLAYNTQKVAKNELPRSYDDLLNPKWKGRIGLDDDLKEYIILSQEWGLEKTEQFLKKLKEEKPKFQTSNTVLTQMVAAGEVYLAPGIIRRIPLAEFKSKGAPVDWLALKPIVPVDILLEGVTAHAPDPHAAELFAYWILGSPEWLKGMYECSHYGNAMVPGNPQQQVLKELKPVYFDWDLGAKAAKEGIAKKFRRDVGAE
ncbi:MAG: ABC transporter substrate-binding protein [Alphaproteobacteria bacterium]